MSFDPFEEVGGTSRLPIIVAFFGAIPLNYFILDEMGHALMYQYYNQEYLTQLPLVLLNQ